MAKFVLMSQIALQPVFHLFASEGLMIESCHHFAIGKYEMQCINICCLHWAENEPLRFKLWVDSVQHRFFFSECYSINRTSGK